MLSEWIVKFFSKGNNSRDVAKKRLQFAIIYDKLDVSEEILGALQQDMVAVISRYFVIDKESLKIDIRKEETASALVVNIPILKAVRQQKRQSTAHSPFA
jgi:cell division topological specificity factor